MDYMRHEPLLQDPNYIRGHGNFFILQMEMWRQQQRYDDIYEEGLRILPILTPIAPLMCLVVEKYKACAVESGNLAFLVAAHQFYITSLKGQLALNTEQELAKRKQQELQYIATHDTLTDVYNRRFLEKEATTYLAQGDRVTMAIFDVDKFKQLNDTYGHAVGDALLVYLGEVAQSHCTVGIQFIARYGGDEFVFVCHGNSLRYRTVFNALQQTTWTYGDITIQLSISMGVAVRQHTSYEELFAAADEALYKAKETRGVLHVEETSIC
ncbi:hypothetical protein A6M13_07075 [Caryophanon tenue]|uniref:GGDEF domain-containing protein n=2 Tax=Caryophanon tenue TaxID=33978 RepID=A0A1C0Y621_9BACL|nr:hypothetical protein A6M13_07075 [Caryophanon tenue]